MSIAKHWRAHAHMRWHDAWCYRVCTLLGSVHSYIDTAQSIVAITIASKYAQHRANIVKSTCY